MHHEIALPDGICLRSLALADAAAVSEAYLRNRAHLEPTSPTRDETFFTEEGQRAEIERGLADERAGGGVPLVLLDADRVIGRVTLSGIARGAFQSANLGYWIDAEYAGRGLMTAAVKATVALAATAIGLHRIQASTLVGNGASQVVLRRCGFERIGMAPEYLRIAGRWQDHLLFQRILSS
ncbi:GNAT family N-acetyltransferase [Microbacterium sp.]|uniref:GNAT family N-acetyltransferase n=1 Tax=Microbacterium sp. TaxID=51671 RepID=UPI0039E6F5D4